MVNRQKTNRRRREQGDGRGSTYLGDRRTALLVTKGCPVYPGRESSLYRASVMKMGGASPLIGPERRYGVHVTAHENVVEERDDPEAGAGSRRRSSPAAAIGSVGPCEQLKYKMREADLGGDGVSWAGGCVRVRSADGSSRRLQLRWGPLRSGPYAVTPTPTKAGGLPRTP